VQEPQSRGHRASGCLLKIGFAANSLTMELSDEQFD
jgi:hypothetical protein